MPLSTKAAAERLGLSIGRVRALIASGQLPAVNVGIDRPLWAIYETELERFAARDRPAHRPRKETRMSTSQHACHEALCRNTPTKAITGIIPAITFTSGATAPSQGRRLLGYACPDHVEAVRAYFADRTGHEDVLVREIA